MSPKQARLLRFMLKYPGWTPIGPDSRRTVRNLRDWGLVEWNEETKQARLATQEG